MSFQVFLIVVFGLIGVVSILTLVRGIAPKLSLVVLGISLAACAAAIWPDVTTVIANKLGIDTGTHLILYCTVLVMMAGFFFFYIRLRQLRRELTLMVRHVALMQAVESPTPGSSAQAHEASGPEGK